MKKFDDVIEQIRERGGSGYSGLLRIIDRYRATHDISELARIKPPERREPRPLRPWMPEQQDHVLMYWLRECLPEQGPMNEEQIDAVRVLVALRFWDGLMDWMYRRLSREKTNENAAEMLLSQVRALRLPWQEALDGLLCHLPLFSDAGTPNSFGRLAGTMRMEDLVKIVVQAWAAKAKPDISEVIQNIRPDSEQILASARQAYEAMQRRALEQENDTYHEFLLAADLADHDFPRYGAVAAQAARASLEGHWFSNRHDIAAHWLLTHFGSDAVPDITNYVTSNRATTEEERRRYRDEMPEMFSHMPEPEGWYGRSTNDWQQANVLIDAVKVLGKDSVPILKAALERGKEKTVLAGLTGLVEFDDSLHRDLIVQSFERGLQMGYDPSPHGPPLLGYLALARRWHPEEVQEHLWPLAKHSSRPVREAAALALAKIGEPAAGRAAEMLSERKADLRLTAVLLLSRIGTPSVWSALEERLEIEDNDTVRDAIIDALRPAWRASGKGFTRAEIEERAEGRVSKVRWPPAPWVSDSAFLYLRYRDGSQVPASVVRYIVARQAMCPEVRPLTELKPLYYEIDRSTSGAFAVDILCGFIQSGAAAKDKWALALAGVLGDDRVVEVLGKEIRGWAEGTRIKLAEFAVQTLARIGSDCALRLLDSLAQRYRTKCASVGSAAVEAFSEVAAERGVTVEELGDAVIPALGFEPGQTRVIDCGGRVVEATIGLDLKLHYVDHSTGKMLKSLPKSAGEGLCAELKYVAADLRDAARAQTRRLENLLVTQHRWHVEQWKEVFLGHALMFPFAVRLVWGAWDDGGRLLFTFRADGKPLSAGPDATFIDRFGASVELPSDSRIGIVHPIELPEEERWKWIYELQEWGIEQPFPQMDRTVIRAAVEQAAVTMLDDYSGQTMNGMTFKGRAERLGWVRGSVCDAGSITAYHRSFPAAGVEAFIRLMSMFIGMDVTDEIEIGSLFFSKAGSVRLGSYEYDEPEDRSDPRLIPLSQLPPVVFSETMGAIRKITAKKGSVEEE